MVGKTEPENIPSALSHGPNRTVDVLASVRRLVEPLCVSEGYELVHAEFQAESGGRILRLYIDKPGGVTLEDCVYISRQTSDLLDAMLEHAGPYQLEVSSPGFDRPLGKLADYTRFQGKMVKIKTARPLDGRRNFKGTLAGVAEDQIKLSVEGQLIHIPFSEVSRARLVSEE
jgi:ribosome maturation factor RimP